MSKPKSASPKTVLNSKKANNTPLASASTAEMDGFTPKNPLKLLSKKTHLLSKIVSIHSMKSMIKEKHSPIGMSLLNSKSSQSHPSKLSTKMEKTSCFINSNVLQMT